MKTAAVSLLLVNSLSLSVRADDSETWKQWSSTTAAPASTPVAQGWTDWITTTEYEDQLIYTTEYKETTVYNTVTDTKTLPPETVYITKTETDVQTLAATVVETETIKGKHGSVPDLSLELLTTKAPLLQQRHAQAR